MTNTNLLPAPRFLDLPADKGVTSLETGDRATSGPVAWVLYELDRPAFIYRPLGAATFRIDSVQIWADGKVTLWLVRRTKTGQDYKRNAWLNEDLAVVRGWTTPWPQQNADLAGLATQAAAVHATTFGADSVDEDEAVTSGNTAPGTYATLDEDVAAAELDDEVPAWERNLARLADGPAADRIAELEAKLAVAEDRAAGWNAQAATAQEQVAELEGQLAASEQMRRNQATTVAALHEVENRLRAAKTAAVRRAEVLDTDYRTARERITELEDAPLRGLARQLVEALEDWTSRGGGIGIPVSAATARLARALGMTGRAASYLPDLILIDDVASVDELASMPTELTVRQALATVELDPQPLLDGDDVEVREAAVVPEVDRRPRIRVIGVLERHGGHDRLIVGYGDSNRLVIPPAAIPAYVAGVRAAGFPAPGRRREIRAQVLGMSESVSDTEHEDLYDPSHR